MSVLFITHPISVGKKVVALVLSIALFLTFFHGMAVASSLPGSVDAGRIQAKDFNQPPEEKKVEGNIEGKKTPSSFPSPPGAEQVPLFLRDIVVEGVSAYTQEDLRNLYKEDMGKQVPLSKLWSIANSITQKYREDGYFLSRAYIPEQEIVDVPRIVVVEGYISEVEIDQRWENSPFILDGFEAIRAQKPIRLSSLEELLLRLNKIPGYRFSGVLGVSEDHPLGEGGVKFTIASEKTEGNVGVALSNSGSKYLGPMVAGLSFRGFLLPLQATQVDLSLSSDHHEIKAASLSHKIPITLQDHLILSLNRSISIPGDSLRVQDIESVSTSASVSLVHNWVNVRKMEISSVIGLTGRHSVGHLSDTLLSRDDIRELVLGISMNGVHPFGRYATNLNVVKGLPFLGGSGKNDSDLSRSRSGTDFQKMTADIRASILFPSDWQGIFRVEGQYASRSLPSSEEFGFGGFSLGRGYDSSELTGDHGVASSVELSYLGFRPSPALMIRPYIFYDIGKVWNINDGQNSNVSASSAGLGVAGALDGTDYMSGWSANMFAAKPLVREIENPQQGGGDSIQFRFQLSRQF